MDASTTPTDSEPPVDTSSPAWPVMGKKPRPNHQRTLRILRAMTPQQKLDQVFKLNERALQLMRIGLRRRFPDLDDDAFERVFLQWRRRCRSRSY